MKSQKEISYDISSFFNELLRWNAKINLLSKSDEKRISDKHLFDSLLLLDHIFPESCLLDVGSGNGFPAIPIAIYRQDVTVVCAESKLKKSLFLKTIKNNLSLYNLFIINSRVEKFPGNYFSYFDIITARSFSSFEELIKKTYFLGKNTFSYLIYNSFNVNALCKFTDKNNMLINSVDKYVHNHENHANRTITKISITKKNI